MMDDNSSKEYSNIKITGPISVTPVVPGNLPRGVPIVILGPTGAGKSTFIEALSKDGSLRISSNKLEGFTQSIGTYKLENVTIKSEDRETSVVYVIDVPGFADTKFSETSVVLMLREWMKVSPSGHLGRILYLTPIHNARMPGSHRKVLRTVQAMTGRTTAEALTIVTTMWDELWSNEAKRRAEHNFCQLRDDIWKDFLQGGSQIVKFYNDQDSALSVVNIAMRDFPSYFLAFESAFRRRNAQLQQTPFGDHLRDDLRNRILNLDMEKQNLEGELKSSSAQANEALKLILFTQLREVDRLLAKFTKELSDNFDLDQPLRPPPPFMLESVTNDNSQSSPFSVNMDRIAAISTETDSSSSLVLFSDSRLLHQDMIPPNPPSPTIDAEAGQDPHLQIIPRENAQGPTEGAKSSERMVIRVMRALKCWGEDTRRRCDD